MMMSLISRLIGVHEVRVFVHLNVCLNVAKGLETLTLYKQQSSQP